MILLNKNIQVQDLVLTLTELTTIENPVYLLVLTNDFNRKKSYLILEANTSTNTQRYDRFLFDANSLADLDTGLYTYAVYESDVAVYDESGLGNPIETGKAKVIAPDEMVQPIIYNSEDDSEYYTYKSLND